jgi:hypothetical protein
MNVRGPKSALAITGITVNRENSVLPPDSSPLFFKVALQNPSKSRYEGDCYEQKPLQ